MLDLLLELVDGLFMLVSFVDDVFVLMFELSDLANKLRVLVGVVIALSGLGLGQLFLSIC
jgi:hypothetical protein